MHFPFILIATSFHAGSVNNDAVSDSDSTQPEANAVSDASQADSHDASGPPAVGVALAP